MDELVHHCLRELAFDGDFGCHPSRLRDFVASYHLDSQQVVDDAYFAFVGHWSFANPHGATTEVFIAPQQGQKRKPKEKVDDMLSVTSLTLLPDAKFSTLDDLQLQYGDALRVAVDAETSFAAITGSHIRPPKLTPMVYTALQFITRGREHGISTVDLGQKTGYDQKTCFYLIKQLLDLELVVKLRRGGVSTNFSIHKYFFERSPLWRQIQDEGANIYSDPQVNEGGLDNKETISTQDSFQPPVRFDPIDARHLSSLSLIQSRIVKLLKHSRSHIHPSQNLLVTIGFLNPTKTDRRFFQSRLRELIENRVVERVMVPSTARSGPSSTPCIRLIPEGNNVVKEPNGYPKIAARDPSMHETPSSYAMLNAVAQTETFIYDQPKTIKLNITLHKQMVDLLGNAGTKGMTLNEISGALANFDRRTVELLLTKLEKVPPPSHLGDLRIVQLMETHGRERRWRYFTVASYREIIANEKLDDQDGPYSSVDFSGVGDFAPFSADDFYGDVAGLNHLMDYAFSKSGKVEDGGEEVARRWAGTPTTVAWERTNRGKKRGREEAGLDTDGGGSVKHVPKKRGRPRKHPFESQHDGPNAAKQAARRPHRRGRDQEDPGEGAEASVPGGTSKGPESAPSDYHSPSSEVPKKRRHPPDDGHSSTSNLEWLLAPRRRGRSSKRLPSPSSTRETTEPSHSRNGVHPTDDHVAFRPVPGPLSPSNGDVSKAKVQLTAEQCDIASQHPNHAQQSAPSELIFSWPTNYHSPDDLGAPTEITDRNQLKPSQSPTRNLEPNRTDIEPFKDPDTESHSAVWMSSSSDFPGFIDHPHFNNASSHLHDGCEIIEGQRSNAVPRLEIQADMSARMRIASESPLVPQKRKEKAVIPHSRSNVSLLRRENEFLRILEESGGIVNPNSKEFLDAHLALLDSLALAREPTSGLPGVKIDKRTIENTFKSLEIRGRVKVMKTVIPTLTGAQRPTRVIYSPAVDQSRLDTFLAELGNGPQGTPYSVNNPSVAGGPLEDLKARRPAQPLRLLQSERRVDNIGHWSKNSGRADQLFESDDQTIHDILLTERTTLAQLYGFIPGKMMRARDLHFATLDAFHSHCDSRTPSLSAERIVNFSQYFRELPVGLYCSLVSTLVQSDELSQFLSTEEGRRVPVKDLPQSLQTLLQIGRARSRERLLELFEILHKLNLVLPLQPSAASSPLIRWESNGDDPSSFDAFTGEVSSMNYRSAPNYWLFCRQATLYLWALSAESPPFWKTVSVCTRLDALNFWNELQPACESKTFGQSVIQGDHSQTITPDPTFARFIGRDTSWSRAYELSWHQRQYLKRFISRRIQDEEGGSVLEKVSWIISAPFSVVKDFLQKERASQLRELGKARSRTPGMVEREGYAKKMAQERELIARKVADAKARKEEAWLAILHAVHHGAIEGVAATRVARVRKRYLQSGVANDRSRWEGEVRDAIQGFQSATKAVLLSAQRLALARPPRSHASAVQQLGAPATPPRPAGLPPTVAIPLGKSIEQLIVEQGPARDDARKKTQKQKKGKDGTNPISLSMKDASAILRARSRETGGRMDWFALRQIFPAVPRNSVRQRIASLKEIPSNEIYMRRLEDQWYRLWKQYRGTEYLPDINPRSQTDFDLINHLEFFRNFVDKNALKANRDLEAETVFQLHSSWDVLANPDISPTWEFLWDSRVDESREKGLLQMAFTTNLDDTPTTDDDSTNSQEVQVAEAALKKMVFGTPNEDYNTSRAAALLHSIGEQPISRAKDNLLSRGVLSKLIRDPQKSKPGRTLKISEINQNALGGSIPQDVFQDATMLDTLCKQQEAYREWPLLASDGDLAMLAQVTSEGLVDFKVDITGAKASRIDIDWNSKKADDDHIETTIYTCFTSTPDAEEAPASRACSPLIEKEDREGHGKTADGTVACCRKYSDGLVNCESCLDTALRAWAAESDAKEQEILRRVLDILEGAGPAGLNIGALIAKATEQGESESVLSVIESLLDDSIPLIVLVGHSRTLIVRSRWSDAWTVTACGEPRINVLPRRWLDLTGGKVQESWRAALRAVIGTIVFRPGIPQAEADISRISAGRDSVAIKETINDINNNINIINVNVNVNGWSMTWWWEKKKKWKFFGF
ncbi:hypothetical protein B0F90DRAFT_1664967 [Multifurca ochricompacta]|uniref:B-block binding subunit of TFIIIC domain-containing protein n=1 Tax=Multifurca ochricompacta TaxID=376703 RepID=A0AAD4MGM6_9AGAM|nr:hypothetical protein B0F90DRAFT_1664967 [Multifurca ochricompacta]